LNDIALVGQGGQNLH